MTRPEMPLMDAVHGWCFRPAVAGRRLGPAARAAQARYRALLRSAEVSPKLGMLLHRDRPEDGASARWVVNEFGLINGEPTPSLLAYVFDPEGRPEDPVRGSRYWNRPTLSLRTPSVRVPVIVKGRSVTHVDEGMKIDRDVLCDAEHLICGDMKMSDDPNNPVVAEDWALNRVGVIASPFWEAHATRTGAAFDDILRMEVKELIGDMRWLMTLLATINALPREMKVAQTLTGRRTVGANVLPYFQHRTIAINLPRDDRVAWATKHLDRQLRNMPRPWHRVIGHWRIVERGKLPDRPLGQAWCRHIPTMVEAGLGMCERCHMLVRWIPNHHRGDPNVGIVEHTYATRAKRAHSSVVEPAAHNGVIAGSSPAGRTTLGLSR